MKKAAGSKNKQTEGVPDDPLAKYSILAENCPYIIYHLSLPDGQYKFVSSASKPLLGYCPDELYQKPWFIDDIIHPFSRQYWNDMKIGLCHGDVPSFYEYQIVHKSGEHRWLHQRNVVIRDENGQLIGINGIITDITERKRAEDAQRKSEDRYRAVVEDQTEFICRFAPDGKLTFVNDAYCRYFGLNREECIGKPHTVVLSDDDAQRMKKHIAELTPENPVAFIEHQIIMSSGEVRWQRWSDRAIFDKAGHVVEYQSVGRDTTVQKRAEEALRESEERYRIVLENVPDLVLVHRNGMILYVNPAMVQTMGYTPDEVLNKPITDYIVPEFHERVAVAIRKRITVERFKPYEIELLTKTGGRRIVIVRGTMIEFGGSPAILNVLTDITERKRIEEELQVVREKYTKAFLSAPDAITISELESGRFIEVNNAASTIFGYSHDELNGKSALELGIWLKKEDREAVIDQLSTLGRVIQYEVVERRKSGELFNASVNADIITIGNIRYLIATTRDITERKRAEEQLKHFNEELEKGIADRTEKLNALLEEKVLLLREVHHRVKNNLQIILSLISLQSRNIKDQKLLDIMGEFQNRIMAMAHVHERMCRADDISRIDLSEIVTFLGTSLFKSHNVDPQHIQLNVEMKDLQITIDSAIPISLIINELISNSIKHAFPKGTSGEITIAGHRGADTLVLSFKDTGIGIPADLDWKGSKQTLGLRLVITLVEQLQGTIELDRSAGTAFMIVVKEKE